MKEADESCEDEHVVAHGLCVNHHFKFEGVCLVNALALPA